jgi:RNA polymerase sigma-70 factor (ECF subfamily)
MTSALETDAPANKGSFVTTHWSLVLRAAEGSSVSGQAALEQLCRAYWYPLYAYIRRQGRGPEEAQDLTQAFFARLLEKGYLAHANPERGKFRTFLCSNGWNEKAGLKTLWISVRNPNGRIRSSNVKNKNK